MSFEPMRHILSRTIRSNPASTDLQLARVLDMSNVVLRKLWGEERAAFVHVLSFREGTLKFETSSPAAKQELSIQSVQIQNEINRQLGAQVVRKIAIQSKGF